jgi:hypothetical protein
MTNSNSISRFSWKLYNRNFLLVSGTNIIEEVGMVHYLQTTPHGGLALFASQPNHLET